MAKSSLRCSPRSPQIDSDRSSPSKSVLSRGLRCSPYLKRENDGQRGYAADETARMEAKAADVTADEANPARRRSTDLESETGSAFQSVLGGI